MSGEPRCRLCALITPRAVHSDLEFAAPRDADLPDEGRAYVEHVTTPDPLRERSGGSQSSSELAMACARSTAVEDVIDVVAVHGVDDERFLDRSRAVSE